MNYDNLKTTFCGVEFPNPFCLSSSPVGNTYDMCARAFDLGWGGVAFKTICFQGEHRITHPSPRLNAYHYANTRVVGLQNVEQISDRDADENFRDVERLKRNYPKNVVIASIMGLTRAQEWAELAARCADAGADLIECNFSCPQMTVEGTGHKAGQNEELLETLTRICKSGSKLPVMVKMTPNCTDMVPLAMACKRGGADAVAAINTVRAISAVDVETAIGMPTIGGKSSISGYSGPAVKPIALRFVAEMAQDPNLRLPISGMGGIYTWMDAVEFLLMGATTLQVTTAILRHGYRIVEDLKEGLSDYLDDHGYQSVQQIVGKALPNLVTPAELSHKTQALSQIDKERCVGCGQCYLACRDGGAQAISLDANRKACVDEEACFGCLMCKHICPVDGCITYKTVPHHLAG